MVQVRAATLGVLVALVVSAVAVADARAASPEYHGFSGSVGVAAQGGEAVMETSLAGAKFIIACSSIKGTGSLTAATGAGSLELTYEACKMINTTAGHAEEALPACGVPNSVWGIALQLGKENALETLTPRETNYTEMKISGAICAAKGTFAISGPSTVCALPRSFTSREVHMLACNAAAGAMHMGSEAFRLTDSLELSRESKGLWYAE